MARPASRRAVLIFAAALPLDLSRRRWPRAFSRFLALPKLRSRSVGADVHVFTTSVVCESHRKRGHFVHRQRSGDFRKRLMHAVESLTGLGYREIVIVGRDCPTLTEEDVRLSFRLLEEKRCVLGPDHRGGLYLIALNASDRSVLGSIVWQRNCDFSQMAARMGRAATAVLPVKRDLDSTEDLRQLASETGPLADLARSLLNRLSWGGRRAEPPLPASRIFERVLWQLPPPSLS